MGFVDHRRAEVVDDEVKVMEELEEVVFGFDDQVTVAENNLRYSSFHEDFEMQEL